MVSNRRRLHSPFSKRQSQESCTICPEEPPCKCGPGEVCIEVGRTCHDCGSLKCVAQALASPTAATLAATSSTISTGALAGAVSGAGVLLLLVILASFFLIKRQRRARSPTVPHDNKEKPVPAEVVLQRRDPNEPAQTVYQYPTTPSFSAGESSANFQGSNLSSHAATQGHTPMSSQSSPFPGQNRSNPNLISATFNPSIRNPDADSVMFSSSRSQAGLPPLLPNVRAALGLPIDPTRGDSSRLAFPRQDDGVRNSVQTASSVSSDLSTEPVMTQGAFRQVLGFTKAEVVRTPKHSMSSLHPSVHMNRLSGALSTLAFSGVSGGAHAPPVPSRLGPAKRSPNRADLEPLRNPFSDLHAASSSAPSPDSPASTNSLTRHSPAPTSATFGDTGSPMRKSWARQDQESTERPFSDISIDIQAESVISAASSAEPLMYQAYQTTAPLNLGVPPSHDLPRTPISAALSTARSPGDSRVAGPSSSILQRQQLLAIDEAKRATMLSNVSSVADSLLSSFPFVPPSPGHPAYASEADMRYSASAYSAADTALSSPTYTQPLTPGGRQRASLDTVALSSDLARYPLRSSRPSGKGVQRTEQ